VGIWRTEGPLAFYRGLPIAMFFSVPALSSYLWVYDTSKALLSASGVLGTEHSALVHAAGAGMAEAVSGIFWTPMELIKNKQQQPGNNLRTLLLVKDIYSSKGVRGLFRGYFLGLLVFMPQTVGPSTGFAMAEFFRSTDSTHMDR
jgi:solute carrier family 25 iron transporter 28/37